MYIPATIAAAAAAAAAIVVTREPYASRRLQVLARPDLINVPGGNNLLMRFLSISEGIQYLSEMGWLERMMHDWKHEYLMADYDKKLYTTWKVGVMIASPALSRREWYPKRMSS